MVDRRGWTDIPPIVVVVNVSEYPSTEISIFGSRWKMYASSSPSPIGVVIIRGLLNSWAVTASEAEADGKFPRSLRSAIVWSFGCSEACTAFEVLISGATLRSVMLKSRTKATTPLPNQRRLLLVKIGSRELPSCTAGRRLTGQSHRALE